MAFNPFIGWSQEKLEVALLDAQEEYAEGKALVSAGAGDTSASKAVQASALTRIRKLLIALNKLDPVKYPTKDITPITQTTVAFPNAWP
jgi:sulfate adenylyltransferase subunit 1 (EFTu-like GTPase family)